VAIAVNPRGGGRRSKHSLKQSSRRSKDRKICLELDVHPRALLPALCSLDACMRLVLTCSYGNPMARCWPETCSKC
jgi:hypothetical protein